LSALLLALLPAFLFSWPVLADEGLRADKHEIAVGESTTLRLGNVSGWFKTLWHDNPNGVIRFEETSNSKARVTALKPGRVSITAKGRCGASRTRTRASLLSFRGFPFLWL